MAKKQTQVSKAVQSTLAPPAVKTDAVKVLVIDPKWREYGAADATDEMASATRLAAYAELLRGADYSKWDAFAKEYDAGASEKGWARPDDLRSRRVTIPLKGLGIVKPVSPTSTNARAKTPEQEKKAALLKAEAEKLTAMSSVDVQKEIDSGKADPERLAKLYPALIAAKKRETKAVEKTKREENAKLYNAIAEQMKLMDKAKLQALLRSAITINNKK